jgi:HlyD family secretion protein
MRARSSRWIRRVVVLVLLAGAAVIARYTLFKPQPVPVTVFRVATGRVEETVTNSKAGTIKSRRRATLSTEIGGRVVELPVGKGDHVRRGRVLVRLADADYRAQVDVQERALQASGASADEACRGAEHAERELARNRKLAADELVSQDMLDQAQSQRDMAAASCAAARAQIGQAQAAIALARANLAKTVLCAPFDGVVADITTELGEYITPSPPGLPIPPVIELIDTDAIYVSAPMDEVDVGKVYVGLPVRVTLDAFPDKRPMGHVTRVAPYVQDVQEQNRTFEIDVEFDKGALSALGAPGAGQVNQDPAERRPTRGRAPGRQPAQTLRPGTSADVEVILGVREGVLRIPTYALLEGDRVLVVRDGKLVSVNVKTGLRNWEFTEIVSGLSAGDAVAVSLDRPEVRPGVPVRIEAETLK